MVVSRHWQWESATEQTRKRRGRRGQQRPRRSWLPTGQNKGWSRRGAAAVSHSVAEDGTAGTPDASLVMQRSADRGRVTSNHDQRSAASTAFPAPEGNAATQIPPGWRRCVTRIATAPASSPCPTDPTPATAQMSTVRHGHPATRAAARSLITPQERHGNATIAPKGGRRHGRGHIKCDETRTDWCGIRASIHIVFTWGYPWMLLASISWLDCWVLLALAVGPYAPWLASVSLGRSPASDCSAWRLNAVSSARAPRAPIAAADAVPPAASTRSARSVGASASRAGATLTMTASARRSSAPTPPATRATTPVASSSRVAACSARGARSAVGRWVRSASWGSAALRPVTGTPVKSSPTKARGAVATGSRTPTIGAASRTVPRAPRTIATAAAHRSSARERASLSRARTNATSHAPPMRTVVGAAVS
jgi:hypothetical protein